MDPSPKTIEPRAKKLEVLESFMRTGSFNSV